MEQTIRTLIGIRDALSGRGRRMARSKNLVVVVALLATGCGLGEPDRPPPRMLTDAQISQLRTEVQATGDRCRALRLSGRVPGFVGSVQCSNPGILAAYQRVDYPYVSLLNIA